MRSAIETAGLDKNKVFSQLKDLQTNLDNLERAKSAAENRVRALEQQLKTVTMELEEQRSIRIDLERQLNKLKEDGGEWRKRYENEARLRIEDVDNLKKKFGVQVSSNVTNYILFLLEFLAVKYIRNQSFSKEEKGCILISDGYF
jgi:chromosome segregation ATPase